MNRNTMHLEQETPPEKAERLMDLPHGGGGLCLGYQAVERVLTREIAKVLPSPTGLLR